MLMNHIPVLKKETLQFLDLPNRKVIIDATIGLGGHARAILESPDFHGNLIGIDQDKSHLEQAKNNLAFWKPRTQFFHLNFRNLSSLISKVSYDGILFDLGVASPHLDDPSRGFSFQHEGPLDMRMNHENPLTAEKILNTYSEESLVKIFREFGEEPKAQQFSRLVVKAREKNPLKTTQEVVSLSKKLYSISRKNPATKIFQALRIAVNDELQSLEKGLLAAITNISFHGRIVVISYHSLEDRIVKHLFRQKAFPCECPPKISACVCGKKSQIRLITKKPITPSEAEISQNPRSRSAKMRVAEKL